jgi:hypothetical protein
VNAAESIALRLPQFSVVIGAKGWYLVPPEKVPVPLQRTVCLRAESAGKRDRRDRKALDQESPPYRVSG